MASLFGSTVVILMHTYFKKTFSFLAKENRTLVLTLAFLVAFSFATYVFATPPTSPYTAGEINDPTCAPGAPNCFVSSTGLASINGDNHTAQLLTVGSTGTDFTIDSTTTPGTSVFEIPTASHTNRGLMSSGDWDTLHAAIDLSSDVSNVLPANHGGTGNSVYSVGDILYASTTTALSKLSDVATGSCLTAGGVGSAPAWGSCFSGVSIDSTLTGAGTSGSALGLNLGTSNTWTPSAGTNFDINNLGATTSPGITIANTTPSTDSALNQNSPALLFTGNSPSGTLGFRESVGFPGAPGSATLSWDFDHNGAYINGVMTLLSNGDLTVARNFNAQNLGTFGNLLSLGTIETGQIGGISGQLQLTGNTSGSATITTNSTATELDFNQYTVHKAGAEFGQAGIADGLINLVGSTSGSSVSILPNTSTSIYTMRLPAAQGDVSTVIANDGSGNLYWSNPHLLAGTTWTAARSATADAWRSVTYGNGMFVAVSTSGTVMTSPDGKNWTTQVAAAANNWNSATYGNGLFVAVSDNGTNRVMTSPDGVTWTSRSAASALSWLSVVYGNGTFVAISSNGITNSVMSSPDGITWTAQNAASTYSWNTVVYGNGLFVALNNVAGDREITSPDGINWTFHVLSPAAQILGATYGNGKFVAVGGGDAIITSNDGITWTSPTIPVSRIWESVAYGDGMFVAVASDGTINDDIMTSTDGVTWKSRTSPNAAPVQWKSVTYGNGVFVAVANNGTTSTSVMTSGSNDNTAAQNNNIFQGGMAINGLVSGAANAYVCITNATGVLSYQATACGTSSERFKHDIATLDNNLEKVLALRPVSYTSNIDNTNYVGFVAEEVHTIEPRLNTYDIDGSIHGVNYAQFAPLLAGAIKELNLKIEPLTSIDPNKDGSLATLIRTYLGSAANGITTIFADKVQTKQLCLEDLCVTKPQLQQILNVSGASSFGGSTGGSGSGTGGTTGTTTSGVTSGTTTTTSTGDGSTTTAGDSSGGTTGDDGGTTSGSAGTTSDGTGTGSADTTGTSSGTTTTGAAATTG